MGEHIVIIEDDAEVADTLQLILEMADYKVSCLGELESLEDLIDMDADCFILDENLPLLSGHIICILLRSQAQTSTKPVILISAGQTLAQVAELSQPDASLQKPFGMNDFLDSVYSVLHKH